MPLLPPGIRCLARLGLLAPSREDLSILETLVVENLRASLVAISACVLAATDPSGIPRHDTEDDLPALAACGHLVGFGAVGESAAEDLTTDIRLVPAFNHEAFPIDSSDGLVRCACRFRHWPLGRAGKESEDAKRIQVLVTAVGATSLRS
jgi:hypothetical protein